MIVLIVVGVVLALGVALAVRAFATPERRIATHDRAVAAVRRSEVRLDELSAEIDEVAASTTTTRRAVRQKALDREARRAVRVHKFQELRASFTGRLADREEGDSEISPPG